MLIQIVRVPILQRLCDILRLCRHLSRLRRGHSFHKHRFRREDRFGRRRLQHRRGRRRGFYRRGLESRRLRDLRQQLGFVLARYALPGRGSGEWDGGTAGPQRHVFKCHGRWVCVLLYNSCLKKVCSFFLTCFYFDKKGNSTSKTPFSIVELGWRSVLKILLIYFIYT